MYDQLDEVAEPYLNEWRLSTSMDSSSHANPFRGCRGFKNPQEIYQLFLLTMRQSSIQQQRSRRMQTLEDTLPCFRSNGRYIVLLSKTIWVITVHQVFINTQPVQRTVKPLCFFLPHMIWNAAGLPAAFFGPFWFKTDAIMPRLPTIDFWINRPWKKFHLASDFRVLFKRVVPLISRLH